LPPQGSIRYIAFMANTISLEAIERATNKPWTEWLRFFEEIDAPKLSHQEIAQKAGDLGGAPNWWRQMVTVAYEQHIGRRIPGQDCDGQFNVSVNKTVPRMLDEALEVWKMSTDGLTAFSDISITRGPSISSTEKWRYWRCGLADGSKVNVNFSLKPPGKTALSVQHEHLESTEQVEHWRSFWKEFISGI
jgi:hypothetical protein